MPHCPKKIPRDFNPKLKFYSPSKSINVCLKKNVASSSINMLFALVQKIGKKKKNPKQKYIKRRISVTTIAQEQNLHYQ
jgi:hypothetical protein